MTGAMTAQNSNDDDHYHKMTASTTRSFAPHVPKWQRFQTSVALASMKTSEASTNTIYQRQYSHVYANRLNELKKRFSQTRSNVRHCERILDLVEDEPSYVVGTLVKESGTNDVVDDNSKCRPDDVLVLEDESGRVYLQTERVQEYCTGVVVAVQGIVKEGGRMYVDEFDHPSPHLSVPNNESSIENPAQQDPHILLLSALECGDPETSMIQRDMLLAYLQGYLTSTASKVSRILIAGGSIYEGEVEGAKQLDAFLVQVCSSGIPVDILPGNKDPTTANWPQRPLHSSLLPQADVYGSKLLAKTPNPYASLIGNKYILGTDGRNTEDLLQFVRSPSGGELTELEALQSTLDWCHMCPTGPDSVPTMPHAESDPMIIANQPNLYFSGNCTKFDTKMASETRLVCVPKFSKTGEAVLVNMNSLS
eukprot:CAMPEP_0194250294 /NCGR_PEP_ID=MMETSP0158-20130606/22657_1 /TAXON_ID=33649 /ORGANISM="Thalassionema nitzschioides, Strain L26-B" /LENGTH=421 /DNA_ID=CAMNT_0038987051 /DNA_START=52 /DNA_END=1313 /DNA_ORIENTATION=-